MSKSLGALAGFEKSGHYFLSGEIGRGYDCGMRVAVEICKLMDRNPDMSMSDLRKALPKTWATPTMSPYCSDMEKYDTLDRLVAKLVAKFEAGEKLGGRAIKEVVTVNGARVILRQRRMGTWCVHHPTRQTLLSSAKALNPMQKCVRFLKTLMRSSAPKAMSANTTKPSNGATAFTGGHRRRRLR